jgi:mersacidin/lichenicidin family type 2 lantibiotic
MKLRQEQPVSNLNIIRAWKDPDYRRSLTEEQRTQLPAHPAGDIEFRILSLDEAGGIMHYSPCRRCHSTDAR